jgi:hypothetical protein
VASIATIIDSIHPGTNAVGVILADQIWVIFDREIDEQSVNEGNFFVEGPDTDTFIGPDLNLNIPNVSEGGDPLESPGYKGIVQGKITFERINLLDMDPYTGPEDTTGDGALWRTKLVFTPDQRLQALTQYTVYISGDEDTLDDLDTGIKARSIFDEVIGVNTGNGEVEFRGSYTGGLATDTYRLKITTAGPRETAKFIWWRDSTPLNIHGPIFTEEFQVTPLDNGVSVRWGAGTFDVDDTFSVVVEKPESFTDNMYWSFNTGSGSIVAVPDEASTSIIGTEPTLTLDPVLTVLETSPIDMSTNLGVGLVTLTIKFSLPLLAAPTVVITGEPVNGDTSIISNITSTPVLTHIDVLAVDTLTITLDPGQLFENNLIVITVDRDTAEAVGGETLAEDFVFWFTTTYNPLYSSVRKVRLEIGSFIKSIPDDTINLAIFEASLFADNLTWIVADPMNKFFLFARREWVTCKAAEILLLNVLGTGGLKHKRLDNLEVTYDAHHGQDLLDKVLGCLAKWEAEIQSGGHAVQKPSVVVKGDLDIDAPNVGRMWEKGPGSSLNSGSNQRYRPLGSRRYIGGWYSNHGRGTRWGNNF